MFIRSQPLSGPGRAHTPAEDAPGGHQQKGRATTSALIAATAFALALVLPLAVLSAAPASPDAGAIASLDASACEVEYSRVVTPTSLRVGETLTVTTSIQFDCPAHAIPSGPRLHTVILLDASGSMAGDALESTKTGILALVDALEIGSDALSKAGLVAFGDSIKVSCPLTGVRDEIIACLDRVEASGGSAIDQSIAEGHRLLREGRLDLGVDDEAREILILLSDGSSTTGCDPVEHAVRIAKSDRILVVAVAIGDASDHDCLRRIATSPRYFFAVGVSSDLFAALERIRRDIRAVIGRLEIVDQPPPALRLVPDSASPEARVDLVTGELTWFMPFVHSDETTISFQLEAIETGRHPTSRGAYADFVDAAGDAGHVDFPVEEVVVVDGPPRPAAPDVDVALEMETHALAIGETSSGSVAVDIDLPEVPGRTHLMLVLDASGSMSGGPLAAQKAAVRAVLDVLEEAADPAFRGGLVMFRSAAELTCPLTDDFDALRACVDMMVAGGGTSVSDGLSLAHVELASGRPSPGQEDIVLMSDGENSRGCGPVEAAADAIKAEGTTIHTVCLGPGCDFKCMERAATSPAHHHRAPLPTDLGGVYGDISTELLSLRPVQRTWLRLDVPDHLTFDPSAFAPAPDAHTERSAIWDIRRLMRPSLEIRFGIEALGEGSGEPIASVRIDFESGARHEELAKGPTIVVGAAGPPTSPTPPTAPTGPTPTPVASPSTSTPPTPGSTIFLPIAAKEQCRTSQPASIALVLDTSISMGELSPDLEQKWLAVVRGVTALTDGLDPGRDRIGFVGFDDGAHVHQALTSEFGRVRESVGGQLLMRSGTDIDAGIIAGHGMLMEDTESAGSAAGVQVMVVVTDGRPSPSVADAALEAALRARADGIHIFVIGIGPDVDVPALSSIASDPNAFRNPSGRVQADGTFRALLRWIECGAPGAS